MQVLRDLHHAFRMIRRAPGMAAVVIGSLAVGIGVNTSVFSWIQSRVLNPLPGVADGARFHLIEPRGETGQYPGTSWLEYRDLRDRLTTFERVIAFRMVPLAIGQADFSERATGLLVSDNYFDGLGLTAAAGRLPQVADQGDVVVISNAFWRLKLGGAPDVVGQLLRVNDRPLTIVGIAPEGFQGTVMGLNFDVWVPATLTPLLFEGSRELENRGQRGYSVIGALKAGTNRDAAQSDLGSVMRRLAEEFPDTNARFTGDVLPFWQSPRGPQRFIATALFVLQGVMLLVLLAVCGNTANLLLARAGARQEEISVRLALGARRWQIVSLLLSESLVLGLIGAGLGALVALWGTEALRAVPMPTPGGMSLRFQTGLDGLSLAFAMTLGLVSGLVFGIAPAFQLARLAPQSALRQGSSPSGRSRLGDILMLVEVTLALVVLVIGALFLKSFNDTRVSDPGFRREGVLLAAYDLRGRIRNIPPEASAAFASRLLAAIRVMPSVESAAIATAVPLDIHGSPARSFVLEGRARPDGGFDQALTNTVSPSYFKTMEIPIVEGSDFADLQDTATPAQAVVNEEFVKRYLDGAPALGRTLESAGRTFAIVGVARNSLYNAFGEAPTPFIYLSYRDRPAAFGEIHLRTRPGAETDLAPALTRVVRTLNPTLPVFNVRSLTTHVETNLVFRRIPARLFVVLGPILLLLAATGIYAVVAHTVVRRRSEIGLRLALGASPARVVTRLLAENLRVIGFGLLAGGAITLMFDGVVEGAESVDRSVLVGLPLLLLAVSAAASWIPARRAARVDPMLALRQHV